MLKTAMIFSDKMVLQRQKAIPVWGEGTVGAKVKVALMDGAQKETLAAGEAVTDEQGRWTVSLPAMEAAEDLCLVIGDGETEIVYTDVCVGEVWIAGGQSNMEYLLGFDAEFDDKIKDLEKNPRIRFFDYPEVAYEEQLTDFDYKHEGFWRGCSPEDLGYFSAVGYYFSRILEEDLQVPVGIVGCNWGGSPACAWMDPSYLEGTPGEDWLKEYEPFAEQQKTPEFIAEYKANPMNDRTNQLESPFGVQLVKIGLDRETQLAFMKQMFANAPQGQTFLYERRPGGVYETMLKKIVPYGCRGVIWYQGETDADSHGDIYDVVFSRMIRNWRDLWQEELPFLFVQLAPFGEWLAITGDPYHVVRAKQQQVSETVEGTWMASSSDAGMEYDIHPKHKRPIGERLALLARGHVYGEDILCEAPKLLSVTEEEDGAVIKVKLVNAQGLHIEGDSLKELYVIRRCQTGSSVEITEEMITAELCGDTLVVKDASDIKELRFAMHPYYEVNLYNEAGIPALPFTWKRK